MKVTEIPAEEREKSVSYICDEIKNVIVNFGDRDPGSEGENKALDYMADQLGEMCDKVDRDKFQVAPHAFFGWTYFVAVFMTLAVPIYFLSPVMVFVCILLSVVPMFFQFVLYAPFLDPLFDKRESGNVMGTYSPSGEVRRRIIINGHSDAVYEWHWHYIGGYKMFLSSIILVILGVVYMFAIALAACVLCGPFGMVTGNCLWIGIVGIVFVPFFLAFWLFADTRKVVPGANDNLTACYMAIAAVKALKDNGIRLENTEVVALITGSEEAGLRGATAFVKQHPDYAREEDVETVFITYETLRELEYLGIYNRDLNGTVKNDQPACEIYKKCAARHGMDLKFGSVFAGATDAAAFSKGGYRATSVAAMNPEVDKYYHTRLDNYDNLSPECLSKVFDITLEFIEEFDKNGFASAETSDAPSEE